MNMIAHSRLLLVLTAMYIRASHTERIEELITVRLYGNGDSSNYKDSVIEHAIPMLEASKEFNREKPLVLLFHGMNMKASSRVMRGLVNAFGKSGKSITYNVLSMHMPKLFKNEITGNLIGSFLCDVIKKGLTSPDKIILIGYSLGAQTAGYAARFVKQSYGLINYIAGLDPAGAGFCQQKYFEIGLLHVSKADALITHLVHTNALYYASNSYLGTADFIFNNGMLQPGCFSNSTGCSHTRAVLYFTEGVLDDSAVVGRQCSSRAKFEACMGDNQPIARIGFPPDTSASGRYYLRTVRRSPFALGLEGARCYARIFWNWLFYVPTPSNLKSLMPKFDEENSSDDDEDENENE